MLERIMIIAGESSGELYGALLANTLKSRNPGLRISGVGGERMESAGVELISTVAGSFGVVEAIRTFGKIKKTFKNIIAAFRSFAPQVVVLIDYPDFNIPIAREARKMGIKVLYYVSPQVWAWRMKRVATIGTLVDSMAVILPFEADIYRGSRMRCEFVGHPAMDEINSIKETRDVIMTELGLDSKKPVMVLMPGSRPHEVQRLLPVMTQAADAMKELFPEYQFVLPVAPNLHISQEVRRLTPGVHLLAGTQSIKALMVADIALIASGTATLQAALLGVPMVVIYKLSPLTYFLGKLIIKIKHFSLVNILLDKSVPDDSGVRVRELLQGEVVKKNIMEELVRLSGNPEYRDSMISQMRKVRALFLDMNASLRVARMVEQLSTPPAPLC
jgi:lipid-A-disaccharide synthase